MSDNQQQQGGDELPTQQAEQQVEPSSQLATRIFDHHPQHGNFGEREALKRKQAQEQQHQM